MNDTAKNKNMEMENSKMQPREVLRQRAIDAWNQLAATDRAGVGAEVFRRWESWWERYHPQD